MSDITHQAELGSPGNDAWKVLRILSEFVDGFEILPTISPTISMFGSSRLGKDSPCYKEAEILTHKIAKKGFNIITGAGPGIMEAINKGAQEAKVHSCGLAIDVPFESDHNKYIDPKLALRFRYFFVRKVMFVRYAQGFVFLPGGFGTLDECFETLTLIQTEKIKPVPIYFFDTKYWQGLISWLQSTVSKMGCISHKDLRLFTVTDDLDEIANGLERHYHSRIKLEEV